MSEIVELDLQKGVATLITKIVEKEVSLQEYLTLQRTAVEINTPILPEDTVSYRKNRDLEIYSIYKPGGWLKVGPTIVDNNRSYEGSNVPILVPPRMILLPFLNGRLMRNNVRLFFTDALDRYSVKNDTIVSSPWLPNTYREPGVFCGGLGFGPAIQPYADNKTKCADAAVKYLEDSHFNDHVPDFIAWLPRQIDEYNIEGMEGFFEGSPIQQVLDNAPRETKNNHGWLVNRLYKVSKAMVEALGEEEAVRTMTSYIPEMSDTYKTTYASAISRANRW